MELTLYTAKMSRGFMVEFLLEELNVPYKREVIDLYSGYTKSKEYRSVHPLGAVPALMVNGVPHFESLALMLYLADAHPESKLSPPVSSPCRSTYLQWMVYCSATLESALSSAFVRSLSMPAPKRQDAATPQEISHFHRQLEPLCELMGRPSILPGFSAV